MLDKFVCIIPARYKSTRFEGKSLALIFGKPMILWVVEHASKAERVSKVIVATDDERILNVVKDAGYEAVLTPEDCDSGSARVATVAETLEDEWVFEMQGDQPMVTPEVVDSFIEAAISEVNKNNNVEVVIPFASANEEQTASPDILKVVCTTTNRLVFQTRQPIRTGLRTLGLYLWKRESLLRFAGLSISAIERAEDSHPIRLYINDFYVQGVFIEDTSWIEVDRDYHIQQVEAVMQQKSIHE